MIYYIAAIHYRTICEKLFGRTHLGIAGKKLVCAMYVLYELHPFLLPEFLKNISGSLAQFPLGLWQPDYPHIASASFNSSWANSFSISRNISSLSWPNPAADSLSAKSSRELISSIV